MVTKTEIRLECLKLAHAQGREPSQVVERAREYENYVSEDLKAPESKPVEPSGKKAVIQVKEKSGT